MKKLLIWLCVTLSIILIFSSGFFGKKAQAEDVYVTWAPIACDDRTLELGECLKLPYEYGNYSGSEVTFTVTMNTNKFFGPEHVVHTEDIPDGVTKRYFDGGPVVCTTYATPLGTDNIIMKVTSTATGGTVVSECSYQLTLGLPSELSDLIQVPCRWCVIEGSPQAEGKKAGELVSGDKLLSLLQKANDKSWTPDAHIAFRSALAPGIPVVSAPPVKYGQPGDIESPGWDETGAKIECEQRWDKLDPTAKGIILLNSRVIWGFEAFAPAPVHGLQIGGERGDDLCGHPRNLLVSDVTPEYVVISDQAVWGKYFSGDPANTLAHELGHVLLLGHGDGLDNNSDGLLPPTPGIRRYDQYCDPLGNTDAFPDEDNATTENSVMDYSGSWDLKPLQIEQARAAAKLVPGASYDKSKDPAGALVAELGLCSPPCGLPVDVFMVKVEMSQTPDRQTTEFTHTVFGSIPSDVDNEYIAFVDLDTNENTGCSPSELGFPTSFQGAELVTRVGVEQAESTPTVWQCQGGSFKVATDSDVRANAFTQIDETETLDLFGIISIHIPDTVVGTVGSQVRIQALARQLGTGGQLDRLPKEAGAGGVISLEAPVYPQCTLTPPVVNPGATTTLEASGLEPGAMTEVYIGNRLLGTGVIDSSGTLQLDIIIPSISRQGVRPITVRVKDTLITAISAVLVEGTALTPATSVKLSPLPNGGGWNNTDVEVTLSAIDAPGGVGIKEITYSASGAENIPNTTVIGDSAVFLITEEGETTVTYFATDNNDNSETSQSITVRLDKTPPVITGSFEPIPNTYGWNNTEVTVSANCEDAISGVLSCPRITTLSTEGENQSVMLEATDLAFNNASAAVSGINIDMTPPTITYSGNVGTYTVYQMVNITCNTADNLSGVASTDCQDISGQGYAFPLGTNTFSAIATDKADNDGTGSTTFTVIVTYDSLCDLTRQFVRRPGVAKAMCYELQAAEIAEARGNMEAKSGAITAYVATVLAQKGKSLTADDAAVLVQLANAL